MPNSHASNPGPSTADAPVDPALAGLEPASMWRHFGALTRIPRASCNEAGVRAYVQAFAAARGIACEVNEVGDVLLRVNPDAEGPVVGLQAHMDMVCVSKDGAPFDFAREPIRLLRDGDSLHADGTSLGADNGIGVAYALALAEEATGPLEVLLTVDEEQGFTGIEGVAPGWLRSAYLINIDSEEEGFLTIASAGARDFVVTLPVERTALEEPLEQLALTLDGLEGGHSGVDIHRGRLNALTLLGRALAAAKACGGAVLGVGGGSAPNVIPSSARATLAVPPGRVGELRARLDELRQGVATAADPALRIELAPAPATRPRAPLTAASSDALVGLLGALPTGILVPSPLDPALPFVSNNLAIVREQAEGALELTLMSRSPEAAELVKLGERLRGIAEAHGATLEAGNLVPGWAPDYGSPLLALFQRVHREHTGKEAKLLEIHAGLECGALQAKYPGMDLISVGPDITGVHSPAEQVSIASALRTYDLVRAVLRELHGGRAPAR